MCSVAEYTDSMNAGGSGRSHGRTTMGQCYSCKNEYDKTFDILKDGRTYTFDSFECATHALAPTCAHCACRILGHGLEEGGIMFCCANCARQKGHLRLRDRSEGREARSGSV